MPDWLEYIDNEVAAFGEWDSTVHSDPSTITQPAAAAWPDRGGFGLRADVDGDGNDAYALKDLSYSIAPGGWFSFGFWLRVNSFHASGSFYIALLRHAAQTVIYVLAYNGAVRIEYRDDAGTATLVEATDIATGRWYYVVIAAKRATTDVAADGEFAAYRNGQLLNHVTGRDNYDRWSDVSQLRLGAIAPKTGYQGDYDEIKFAAAQYVEPYAATPQTEYPDDPARTVVLLSDDSDDSWQFAEYCISELGIPYANLCPLACGSAESLVNYADFQNKIETPLADWLARNPTVSANVTTFLVGYNVPGYFTDSGKLHTTGSRLMRIGQAFSSQTANPLYSPDTVARLTASDLSAAGLHLACRIDAASLAAAKAIVDRGLAVTAAGTLPDTDYFCSDDADLRSALAVQHLRMATTDDWEQASAITIADDLTHADPPAGGTRAAIVEKDTNAQTSLRGGETFWYNALAQFGYAAGVSFSAMPADGFAAEKFVEMLRIGGSFAEAAAVAVEHLDYTALVAGLPGMRVIFPKAGHNIYHGVGGPEAIDWNRPVAYSMAGAQQVAIPLSLAPGRRHVLAARTTSSEGIEEHNSEALTYVEIDEAGTLQEAPLPVPSEVTAQLRRDGKVLVGFSCYAGPGLAVPTAFDVLTDNGTGTLDVDDPAASIPVSDARQIDHTVVVTAEQLPAKFAVRACKEARRGEHSQAVTVRPDQVPAVPNAF